MANFRFLVNFIFLTLVLRKLQFIVFLFNFKYYSEKIVYKVEMLATVTEKISQTKNYKKLINFFSFYLTS